MRTLAVCLGAVFFLGAFSGIGAFFVNSNVSYFDTVPDYRCVPAPGGRAPPKVGAPKNQGLEGLLKQCATMCLSTSATTCVGFNIDSTKTFCEVVGKTCTETGDQAQAQFYRRSLETSTPANRRYTIVVVSGDESEATSDSPVTDPSDAASPATTPTATTPKTTAKTTPTPAAVATKTTSKAAVATFKVVLAQTTTTAKAAAPTTVKVAELTTAKATPAATTMKIAVPTTVKAVIPTTAAPTTMKAVATTAKAVAATSQASAATTARQGAAATTARVGGLLTTANRPGVTTRAPMTTVTRSLAGLNGNLSLVAQPVRSPTGGNDSNSTLSWESKAVDEFKNNHSPSTTSMSTLIPFLVSSLIVMFNVVGRVNC